MAGKLYGVGVGPGDPELLTLKALRLVKEAEVIALPGQVPEDTVAFKIVEGAYPELGKKELLAVPFPMSKDPEVLKSYHDAGAEKVKAVLDQGKDVVFLTLGDPTVYSTYLYIHHRLVAQGYETEIVCGITSFCAVSARLNTGLVEKAEPLHVIPASYQIEDALKLSGTKVLMKAGKKMKDVKAELLSQGAEAMMIENCGMPDEKIYRTVEEIPEDAGYYSLIIIKENKDRREEEIMVHFVGAGPGAPDLITVRGKQYLEEADVIIYAGSLVNPQLLEYSKDVCTIHNSAKMTLEEVISVMERAEAEGKMTVRLHTGDPCIYGAIREQMDILDEKGIPYDSCPGVSAFCGAASALNLEYTLPDISQSVIITRMEGRTPVPAKESIQSFAAHNATMVIFLSTGMLEELSRRLVEGGYREDTPAAIVYKATWPDEKKFICTVGTLAQTAKENKITKTALMLVGDAVNAASYDRSKLYDPGFTTEFREATK